MYKFKLLLLPVAWLLAFMALACAPPDDDDASSGPSSGPTINNAIYDFATALLTVQGSNLSPTTATQAQIQTIRVGSQTNGVDFSSYTADEDATGVNSNGLEQGKYRMKSDGTALWLKLTEQHKAVLEAKVGSDGLKKGLLTSSGAWAGLDTAKDLTVRNIPAAEQVDDQSPKQTEDEQAEQVEQAEEESPKQAKDEQVEQAEEESPKQAKVEQAEQAKQAEQTEEVEDKQSKTETEDQSLKLPEAEETEEESRKLPEAEETEEESPKQPKAEQAEEVEQAEDQSPKLPDPAITRATYNVNTGFLEITGTNLPAAVADWDFSKLTLVSGDGSKRFTLPKHSTLGRNTTIGSQASATKLFIELRGSVKAKANAILVNDGESDANGAYNLEAAAGFAGGSAEDTTNPITVSGYTASITSATYDANTGELYIIGIKLPTSIARWDFSKLTLVSGDGSKRYPLPEHETAGENTATGSRAGRYSLNITLSGSVKAEADKILVNDGDSDNNGAYNLEAAAGFAGGSAEDPTNPITVSGYVASITLVSYVVNIGQLSIIGSRLPIAVADWDFSKLTLVSGDGSKRFTLPRHATAGENKATGSNAGATGLVINLRGNVKAKADAILFKAGKSDNAGAYNLEAAAGFVSGSAEDLTNAIQVVFL